MPGAPGRGGVPAATSAEGATGGAVFHACLGRVLLPALREREPDAAPVTDDLRAHETPEVRGLLDGSGLPCRRPPSCSPDLGPTGPARAQAKAEPRRVAAHDEDASHRALGPALDRVPAANVAAHFRHCGYERPG